jgi:CheY-like chemotaxis protein
MEATRESAPAAARPQESAAPLRAEDSAPLRGDRAPDAHAVRPLEPAGADVITLGVGEPVILPAAPSGPLVAVVNDDEALVEDVRRALEAEGLRTIGAQIATLQGDRVDLLGFLRETNPDVVVFDIVQPFAEHLATLKEVRGASEARDRPFIVTTTDRAALAARGLSSAVQFREPEDLVALARAVRDALATR